MYHFAVDWPSSISISQHHLHIKSGRLCKNTGKTLTTQITQITRSKDYYTSLSLPHISDFFQHHEYLKFFVEIHPHIPNHSIFKISHNISNFTLLHHTSVPSSPGGSARFDKTANNCSNLFSRNVRSTLAPLEPHNSFIWNSVRNMSNSSVSGVKALSRA